jgi:hypothetical protein
MLKVNGALAKAKNGDKFYQSERSAMAAAQFACLGCFRALKRPDDSRG